MADLVTIDEVLSHLNMDENPPTDIGELELFVRAATDYVADRYAIPDDAPVGADLKLAVLEDIRGLYQPGQIGPPATFGAFDIDDGPSSGFRPVNMWPRLDAWLTSRLGSAIA